MYTLFYLVIGFILGAVVAWAMSASKSAGLKAQLDAQRDTGERIRTEFKAAATETLQKSAEQFLTTAMKDLRQVKTETDDSVGRQKQEIAHTVAEMKTKLEEYQKLVVQFEKERTTIYGRLGESMNQVLNAERQLWAETSSLKKVLTSSSGVRGKWGEHVLQEILEQNDLVRGIHYDTQVAVGGENGMDDVRPDFVVRLAGGKKLIIDSKEVAGEYVLAQETEDPNAQREHYQKLVANIRSNVQLLSRKEYQERLDADVPFVVMFIPSEAAIRAAFATDPAIFQEAVTKKVILASPMTVIPLIQLIRHSWQQQKLAENARVLGSAVEELGRRLAAFVGHLQGVGGGIRKAAEGWEKAVNSWQTRVFPQIERTRNLGGKIKETEQLEGVTLSSSRLPVATPEDGSIDA
ncbi:DNA recombination protein RmuC [Candidatus Uhrbacteria bacterium]|nr:DNA recombination protein RmuC [Candidatus Uhrbacteria bacterium]